MRRDQRKPRGTVTHVDEHGETTQSAFWESEASNWIAWARTPGHDSYWEYSEAFFRDIVPKAAGPRPSCSGLSLSSLCQMVAKGEDEQSVKHV